MEFQLKVYVEDLKIQATVKIQITFRDFANPAAPIAYTM
jgi:hypothetical protein